LEETHFELQNLVVKPKNVKVRSFCDLSISFSLNCDLPKDTWLVFRFRGGRNNKNDWYFLQTQDKNENGYCKLKLLNESAKFISLVITGKELLIKFLISEQNGIKQNSVFKFKVFNTLAQSLEEKNKKIEVFVGFPSKKPFQLENRPTFNVINDQFDHLTIICPSSVAINEDFRILIRAEDKYKNLVKNFSGKLQLFELKGDSNKHHICDAHLNHDNSGIFRKEGLKFSDLGIFFIGVYFNNSIFISNPIVCRENVSKKKLYWGFIHGHTLKSDGMRELDEYFTNLLNAGLDFGTCTEHDHLWETNDKDFEEIRKKIKKYNKDGTFVSIFGYEWGSWYSGYGDICIYYFDDNIPVLSSDLHRYSSTKKLIKNLRRYKDKVIMIAHHTALRPGSRNWEYFDNSLEKLVEIYSTWGCQEYSFTHGNPLPPRYKFFSYGKYARKRGAIIEKKNAFVSDALIKGYKLGFTAGGDDHFGIYPSGSIDPDNGIYPPGIMAIWAENLTKNSIWSALNNRKCYGTTGPRVVIEFYIETFFMGDIIDLKKNPHLKVRRNIHFSIISLITIEKVELIRNNVVIKEYLPNLKQFDSNLIDLEDFNALALKHTVEKKERFLFYYLRVFLLKNNMAWSSPIWLINST